MPGDRARKLPRAQAIPTALIGKLAVDRGLHGQGLGTILLIDAFGGILRQADHVAIHAVVVDAIDDNARGFYRKHGFEELRDDLRTCSSQ